MQKFVMYLCTINKINFVAEQWLHAVVYGPIKKFLSDISNKEQYTEKQYKTNMFYYLK